MARLQYPLIIESDPKYKALSDLGKQQNQLDLSLMMTNFIDLLPSEFLALLAEKWSVTGYDGWLLAESDTARRQLIKRAVELHRYKGTPWAMREIIRQLGFGEVEILEGLSGKKYNGEIKYDGKFYYGEPSKWASYRVVLNSPITNDQAELLRKTLRVFAPARCVLESLDYRQSALRYNGKAKYDGAYNYGAA
ncbi:phage tail protein [Pasteurellaceae bacterium USgator11]|nr:phage tail protein [Pasteurellaceae bacterium USgator41]TNG96942.1 phage tail protein [Pasteurellaceae bacterium UScroc12]TNG97854.1 phage tail protein [Pasteurellaceae bacterium UScroc31]TNH02913.1 phage tail protein [Pasteurellaceae bacterium USgator11]